MNTLKTSIIALLIGAGAVACQVEENQECYTCTATDPNGQGNPVSENVCRELLSSDDIATFEAEFTAQHDPTLYDIECEFD